MKPANFPARKLERQMRADGRMYPKHDSMYVSGSDLLLLETARAVRTKKRRVSARM